VIVPDRQLSLAIGKEGQNARLAAKLTGWRIDIKSVSAAEAVSLTWSVTTLSWPAATFRLDGVEGPIATVSRPVCWLEAMP
jgi:transcription antitermination factor NusA-like protein